MEGSLHALALMIVALASLLVCRKYGRRPRVVLPAFVMVLALAISCRMVMLPQWILLGCCAGLLLYFVPLSWAKRAGVLGIFLLLGALSYAHYTRLVNLPYYCPAEYYEHVTAFSVRRFNSPLWHSWLTGVYVEVHVGNQRQIAMPITCGPLVILMPLAKPGPPAPYEFGRTLHLNLYDWPCKLPVRHPDLEADLDAWCLLAILGATLTIAIGCRRAFAPAAEWNWRIWYILALAVVFGLVVTGHQRAMFIGIRQWIIPGWCFAFILGAYTLPWRQRAVFGLALIGLSILLTLHLDRLVDNSVSYNDTYTMQEADSGRFPREVHPVWHSRLTHLYKYGRYLE